MYNKMTYRQNVSEYPGMFVYVHAGVVGDVLGADYFTVSLKSIKLEELGCRQEL